ncbi:unnamed protein product [Linum tenue]|uniref:Uncharacterized protein n=1 Tax=Linum tenue TaxID=586396 RepID=A0AAV0QEU0_9ROSI|nr:unnamed protein product [Linum tenue]
MRRQGQYADSGGTGYGGGQMQQHTSSQRVEQGSDHFQGQLEAFTPERETSYTSSKPDGQWRWVRDESKPVASQMFNEGQVVDASRTYIQGKRPESHVGLEQQGNVGPRARSREEDMQSSYEDKPRLQTFEGLEQKFIDDIMKLAKEQSDAEDAEISRHREKIKSINDRHQEQLSALRARHASRREELLRKESQVRQHRYQQAMMDHYPNNNNSMAPGESLGYSASRAGSASINEAQQANYSGSPFDSYQEKARFLGSNARDQGYGTRGQYPAGGRVYDSGTRYY